MKNQRSQKTAFRTFIVIIMVVMLAVGVTAQTNTSTPSFATELSNIINGMELPQDKFEATLKLTTAFLAELQKANQELTKLMTPQVSGGQTTGGQGTNAQLDAKTQEKIALLGKEFGIKMEQFNLDLSDNIGESNAAKIIEKIHQLIPKVLLENSKISAANHTSHSGMAGTPTPTPPANGPAEVPLGSAPNNSGNSNTGTMPGTPGASSGNTNGMGINAVNLQILLQLQATNSMLIQMLSIISAQSNSETLKAQLQPIFQLIANQAMLIQMLYANLTTGSMNNGSTNSSGMNMGGTSNSGSMGNMGGMGMM